MNWFQKVFSIKSGTDYENTAAAISKGISMRGTNAWLMVCSALLASIGLDTNSSAVIIGAMLISPLMSPILGVGYSVGVHDRELFIRSIRNLFYLTFFSLIASVLYFRLTPLGEPTTEILARTHPTLLDIGVAFFGGVAGIVSGSRKEKTNAIPGVAIATALMPPLCTSGYGLATGRWEILGGAFYLFFINAVFISLSTYLFVKLLHFPVKHYVEKEKQKRVSLAAWTMAILISAPSIWFLYSVYQKNKTNKLIQQEIVDDFKKHGNEILKWEMEDRDSLKMIKVFFSGEPVSDDDRLFYSTKLKELGLDAYSVRFFRMNFSKNEMSKISTEMMESITKNIELQNRIRDSLQNASKVPETEELLGDLKSFYPDVAGLAVAQMELKGNKATDTLWTAWVQWDSLAKKINKDEAALNIRRYLTKRLKTDTVWLQQTEQLRAKQ